MVSRGGGVTRLVFGKIARPSCSHCARAGTSQQQDAAAWASLLAIKDSVEDKRPYTRIPIKAFQGKTRRGTVLKMILVREIVSTPHHRETQQDRITATTRETNLLQYVMWRTPEPKHCKWSSGGYYGSQHGYKMHIRSIVVHSTCTTTS